MPDDEPEDPACSRGKEQGLKGEQLDFEPNVEENKGGIYSTEDQTVAREKTDPKVASQVFKDDADTEVAESKQYHENDDLTETDVSNDLLCAGVKKLIVKSFKRKQRRSTVRKRSLKRQRLTEATSHDDFGDAVCKAYSRCSVPYFSEVVSSVCKSKSRVELVRSTGFGYMLELDDCLVPRPFAQWIADKVIVEDEEIIINKKRIPLTAQGVLHVFDIPSGDINISLVDDIGKIEFLAFFGLSEVPTIKFFGSKIIQGEELSDEQFIRCFLIVVLSTVLCPTSNTKPSTKYMGSLIDVKKIRDLNWYKFTHMWLLQAISKYQKEKTKHDRLSLTLGGCIYQLAVRFLDFTNFGSIQVPSVMPRICVWKGSMVKNFSDMLIDENGMYRPSKIKDESETCYAQESFSWASTTKNSNLRAGIDRTVGKSLPEKVKDDIFNSFQFFMKDENVSTCMKAKNLLLKTLQLVTSANVDSEHTLKVESSENNHNSVEEQHWSGSTVKVNSDGDYVEDDGTALVRRVKRMKQISQQSPVSIESDRRNPEQDKSQGNRGEGDDAIGSTKSVHAYNQGNNVNEQIEDNKKGEGIEPEEVRENTSKDDTNVLQARQEVSKRVGVERETKVTGEHDAVEANIKETRAPSTSSFEYLLEAKNSTMLHQIQGKEAGKGNAPSFAGFTNQKTCGDEHLSQDKNNTNVINQGNKGSCSKIDFDINVTLTAGEKCCTYMFFSTPIDCVNTRWRNY